MRISALLLVVFVGASLSAIGGIFLKVGAEHLKPVNNALDVFQFVSNWRIILGLIMYFIPAVIWIYVLRTVEISLLQPLLAIVYVMTPLLAVIVLKEHVSMLRWSGIAVILFGVVLVAKG